MKDKIIEFLYKTIKVPYEYFFKNGQPWGLNVDQLLCFEAQSLGHELGTFLKKHHYEVQDSLEEHDVFHVLTKIGTTVKEEVDLQFYLLGNGKRSPFVFIVILTGILFYPKAYKSFYSCYKRGKKAHQFYHLDFYKMLTIPVKNIQQTFNI